MAISATRCQRTDPNKPSMDEHWRTKMLNKATTLVCACAIALLTGCSGGTGKTFQPETALDRNWGRSYESAKYNQIANPNAGKSLKPVEGLDGQPAANVVD